MIREATLAALLLCDTEAVIREMAELLVSEDTSCRSLALEVLSYKAEDRALHLWEQLLPKHASQDLRLSSCMLSEEATRLGEQSF